MNLGKPKQATATQKTPTPLKRKPKSKPIIQPYISATKRAVRHHPEFKKTKPPTPTIGEKKQTRPDLLPTEILVDYPTKPKVKSSKVSEPNSSRPRALPFSYVDGEYIPEDEPRRKNARSMSYML